MPLHPDGPFRRGRGFTLIELAVVLFLLTLVLGGIMTPLATQIEQKERTRAEAMLQDIRETLIGHALVNGHLPCPDCPADGGFCGTGAAVSNDGIEDGVDSTNAAVSPRATPDDFTACAVEVGNLPWVTLGVDEFDPWGVRFVYSVDEDFADNDVDTPVLATCPVTTAAAAGVSFKICSLGEIAIWEDSLATIPVAANVPAVVYSLGSNGSAIGGAAPTSPNELDNWWTDVADRNFVSTDYNTTTANAYDDLFTWITPNMLIYRMVTAERLP